MDMFDDAGYDVRNVECVSNPHAKYKSFRINVPTSEYDAIHSDDFPWPGGVRVRQYIWPRRNDSRDV